jgi:ketosteroid isomerase-like protein
MIFMLFSDYNKGSNINGENLKDTLMNIDREFSKLSAAKGIKIAFTSYADDEVILLRQGRHPVLGIEELKELYNNLEDDGSILTWEPVKADVSGSGDLGYTFGNWELTAKSEAGTDTIYYGNYTTIWKKQPDGSWKFVLDGGTSTPPPTKLK